MTFKFTSIYKKMQVYLEVKYTLIKKPL